MRAPGRFLVSIRPFGVSIGRWVIGAAALLLLAAVRAGAPASVPTAVPAADGWTFPESQPLRFEANRGQSPAGVDFVIRGGGRTVFIGGDEAVFALQPQGGPEARVLRMKLLGAEPDPAAAGLGELPGKVNYLIGKDPRHWRTNIPTYAGLRYTGVYPGIDLAYYGRDGALEYDFIVAPDADPAQIRLGFAGAEAVTVAADGQLVLHTQGGGRVTHRPDIYQMVDGERRTVAGGFAARAGELGFELAAYDPSLPLVIDPVVHFSAEIGGSGVDAVYAMHENAGGRYLTGTTLSFDFPTTFGAYDTVVTGSPDWFATKFDPSNSVMLWTTYIGSTSSDYGGDSWLAPDGSLYIGGHTLSAATFPDAGFGSKTVLGSPAIYDHAFVRLHPTGSSVLQAAIVAGNGADYLGDVRLDSAGNLLVTGATFSSNFPNTGLGLDLTYDGGSDAIVYRLNGTLSSLLHMTHIPGTSFVEEGAAVAVDTAGSVYVYGGTSGQAAYPATTVIGPGGGRDLFIAKLDATLSSLTYNTRIGGSSNDPFVSATYFGVGGLGGINGADLLQVDADGNAWATGATLSADFPTTAGVVQPASAGGYEVFVAGLDPAGANLVAATYLGGNSTDLGRALRLDGDGFVHVTGGTASTTFPTTPGDAQTSNAGNYDFFRTVLSPDLTAIACSSFWGGNSTDIASAILIDPLEPHTVRLAGHTFSSDWPLLPGGPGFGTGGGYDVGIVSLACGDSTPPDTAIDAATDGNGDPVADGGSTLSDAITFAFSGSDDVAVDHFECSLDSEPFAGCASPVALAGLDAGGHSFQVRAVDSSANADPSPTSHSWTILTPCEALANLVAEVEALGLPPGLENALVAKLAGAASDLNKNPPRANAALGKLGAFENQVQGLSGNPLPEPVADALLAAAGALVAAIEDGALCGP